MTDSVAALLEKARASIEAAGLLLPRFPDFAAARAYYALFYTAEAVLLSIGLHLTKHGAVHAAFGERFAKTRRLDPKYHRYLLEAFDQRLLADYETGHSTSPQAAAELIERAQEFLTAASALLTGASGR